MPPKKETKKPAAKSAAKPAAKHTAKSAAKPAAGVRPAKSAAHAAHPAHHAAAKPASDEIRAVVVLLMSKCPDGVALLIGQEVYLKWGAPTSSLRPGESVDAAVRRCFADEIGFDYPPIVKTESFRSGPAHVVMAFTNECISTVLGPKVTTPNELIKLERVPVSTLFSFIDKNKANPPGSDTILRKVFVDMLTDNKSAINKFISSI